MTLPTLTDLHNQEKAALIVGCWCRQLPEQAGSMGQMNHPCNPRELSCVFLVVGRALMLWL